MSSKATSKAKLTEAAKYLANTFGLVSIFAIIFMISVSTVASADSNWNASWTYVRPITITNSSALVDYQVLVNITNTTNMNSTGQDVRFTYDDNTTVLSYWIENWATNNAQSGLRRISLK